MITEDNYQEFTQKMDDLVAGKIDQSPFYALLGFDVESNTAAERHTINYLQFWLSNRLARFAVRPPQPASRVRSAEKTQ